MKTFLKVILVLIAVVAGMVLLPFALVFGCVLVACLGVIARVGLSVAAGLLGIALLAALVLSPIWLPVLAIVGCVTLAGC